MGKKQDLKEMYKALLKENEELCQMVNELSGGNPHKVHPQEDNVSIDVDKMSKEAKKAEKDNSDIPVGRRRPRTVYDRALDIDAMAEGMPRRGFRDDTNHMMAQALSRHLDAGKLFKGVMEALKDIDTSKEAMDPAEREWAARNRREALLDVADQGLFLGPDGRQRLIDAACMSGSDMPIAMAAAFAKKPELLQHAAPFMGMGAFGFGANNELQGFANLAMMYA